MKTFLAEKKSVKKIVAYLLLAAAVFCLGLTGNNTYGYYHQDNSPKTDVVYMAEINGELSKTTVSYIERALYYAELDNADFLLLNLNGYSGYDNDIKKFFEAVLRSNVHTVCYVDNSISDGAVLVALACDTLVMSPGAVMETDYVTAKQILNDEKKLNQWKELLLNILYCGGYNVEDIKEGLGINSVNDIFADRKSVDNLQTAYSISADEAAAAGLVDFEATSLDEIFNYYDATEGILIEVEKNSYERLVDILAMPLVSTVMLALGMGILLSELFSTKISLNSVVGIICMVVYFFGGYHAGSAVSYVAFLFLGSVMLLLFELFFSPGNGICGIIGASGFFASIMMMAPSMEVAVIQIIIVVVTAVVIIMTSEKSRNILKKLILRDRTTTDKGYLSQPINIRDYLNCEGVALTALRPAGAVKIGSERVDVVTEGDFIAPGDKVKVIKVDGSSVIVRKL